MSVQNGAAKPDIRIIVILGIVDHVTAINGVLRYVVKKTHIVEFVIME